MPTLELDANVAPFAFRASGLDPAAFEVVRWRGREAVSEPYRFEVELASRDADVDFASVLGKPASLVRHRGPDEVPVHGVVASFELGARTSDRTTYRAVLVPALWRMGLARQSRVFQEVTVEEVARALLTEHGLTGQAVRFALKERYPEREYIVQYEESDLGFFQRILEHDGIWFGFEHPESGARETLVVTDDRQTFKGIPPGPGGEAQVIYRETSGLVRDRAEAVEALSLHERVIPGRVVLKDYNYRTPNTDLLARAPVENGGETEVYLFGDHFKDLAEGNRLARVRADEIACTRRIVRGAGDVGGFRAGATFTLEGHYRADLDGDYLLTAVEHEGGPADAGGDGAPTGGPVYTNRFEAIPARAPFRPARITPVPKAPGLMTARTETAGGPYAYIDEEGRYRAKLALDRSDKSSGQASRPVRMVQPYSGPGYGMHFPNHAGTEIVLGFANGDVDRPIALGTVPNPTQGSPATASNRSQNVVKTMGGNGLTMDDLQGDEHVTLTSTKDHTEAIANDQAVNVGSNQAVAVGGNRRKSVTGNQSESVGGDKAIAVRGSHAETITGSGQVDIGGNETRTTRGDQAVTVLGKAEHSVSGTFTHTVVGDVAEAFAANFKTDVGGTTTLASAGIITIQCGAASITMNPGGKIEISGTEIVVNGTVIDVGASGSVSINAPTVDIN